VIDASNDGYSFGYNYPTGDHTSFVRSGVRILWAKENGVTSGVSKIRFGVGQVCTRSQVVISSSQRTPFRAEPKARRRRGRTEP
jgi:hypothetical protein